jgi:hypothetical protein
MSDTVAPASTPGLCVYAVMAHKGRGAGVTHRVEAANLAAARAEVTRMFPRVKPWDTTIQLQVTADGREVVGAIL